MILAVVDSVNNVPIRLTDERWYDHILVDHPEMSGYMDDVLATVSNPEYILRIYRGARAAVASFGSDFLHVYYREVDSTDGFIITAFFKPDFNRQLVIWDAEDHQ